MVNFFQTASRVNDVNKLLNELNNVNTTATGEINPVSMTLDIDYDAFDLNTNYCYINIFKRYYFVDYTIIGNLVRCKLKCDPLMSFKNDILNADIIAVRSSSRYNRYLVDKVATNTKRIKTYVSRFPFEFDTTNTGSHYIITVGGR